MSNITQVVRNEKNMTTLSRGIVASGLDQVLSGTGPYTVFAPSDLAFGKLEAGTIENLLKPESKVKLTEIMNHHVVSGKISFKDLKDGDKLETVNGNQLHVEITNGKVSIRDAVILGREAKISNGVIHNTDTVFTKKLFRNL